MESNLDFFKSLNYDDGLEVVTSVFRRFPLQYGATLGRDGVPQLRPLEFKFEEDGVLYFDTVSFYSSCAEMEAFPHLQICVCDRETMSYVRLGGRVNFTRDEAVIRRCFENSPVLTSQFGHRREVVVGYYLTEVWAEFASFSPELPNRKYTLPNRFDPS
ncbi:MAG: pyridoxamine 5'-phosphate oxidase family protein [Oscillospiraceae bacterium]|nr:pyridoxamine 5'-phosphate oxidase family protein [Oscillospiraceae bacterium]